MTSPNPSEFNDSKVTDGSEPAKTPRPRRKVLVLAGLVTLLVVALVMVGVYLNNDGHTPDGTGSSRSSSPSASTSPQSGQDYVENDDLCEQVDWKPLNGIVELEGTPKTRNFSGPWKVPNSYSCGDATPDDNSDGILSLDAVVAESTKDSKRAYDERVNAEFRDEAKKVNGTWEAGLVKRDMGETELCFDMIVRDHNMVLYLALCAPTKPGHNGDASEAMQEVATDLFKESLELSKNN